MECLHSEENRRGCTCTYEPCSRKGFCCQCIAYHRQMGEVPGCLFPADIERTYDRSVARFIRTMQQQR